MTASATASVTSAQPTPRQQFLDAYEREHAITMKVLRAYPPEKSELRPHPRSKTARELAWIFALERGLGKAAFSNAYAEGRLGGGPPPVPERWEDVLTTLEAAHDEFRDVFNSYSDQQLQEPIKFFGGPKTLVDVPRLAFAWFLIHDQIHHRGQFSVYLRMADGKVPSIYGPSGDEPWF
jgi:uncharacterized damage-inducible protein DinB